MKHELKWLAWEITRRCNLRCVHCRSSSELEMLNHPACSTETAYRIIDDLVSFAKPVVVLTGGEPLLRPDVFDIAHYGTKKGLRMCLATNGSRVTPEVCKHIKASEIRTVALSLDGPNAAIHDDFRQQPGAFEAATNAAQLFKAHDIEFLINSSFTKRNQQCISETYHLAKNLGAVSWYLFMIVPTGRGQELMAELISEDDYEQILDWHYQIERAEDSMLVRPTCAPHYYRVRFEHNQRAKKRVKSKPLSFSPGGSKGCLAGQTIALLDVDGNILPCSYFPKSAGNVHKQTFREIWETSPLLKSLRDFSSYKGRCGDCEYIKICGGCRARAYTMTGDYLAEEPFCNHTPRRLSSIASP